MKRRISYSLYLLTFVMTGIIFVIGMYVGTLIEGKLKEDVGADIETLSEEIVMSELLMLIEDTNAFCPFYEEKFEEIKVKREEIGEKLDYLEEIKEVYDQELKKKYFEIEVVEYLLANKLKDECMSDIQTILYFYSNTGCDRCKEQGEELTIVRQTSDVLVYSFDGTIGSTVVQSLQDMVGAHPEVYPTIVIDGEVVQGFMGSEDILERLE